MALRDHRIDVQPADLDPEPADLSRLAIGQPIGYPGKLRQATPEELLSDD